MSENAIAGCARLLANKQPKTMWLSGSGETFPCTVLLQTCCRLFRQPTLHSAVKWFDSTGTVDYSRPSKRDGHVAPRAEPRIAFGSSRHLLLRDMSAIVYNAMSFSNLSGAALAPLQVFSVTV